MKFFKQTKQHHIDPKAADDILNNALKACDLTPTETSVDKLVLKQQSISSQYDIYLAIIIVELIFVTIFPLLLMIAFSL